MRQQMTLWTIKHCLIIRIGAVDVPLTCGDLASKRTAMLPTFRVCAANSSKKVMKTQSALIIHLNLGCFSPNQSYIIGNWNVLSDVSTSVVLRQCPCLLTWGLCINVDRLSIYTELKWNHLQLSQYLRDFQKPSWWSLSLEPFVGVAQVSRSSEVV